MKNINNLLREIKQKTSMSEMQIAVRLGISQPTVNRILSGQTECRIATFIAIQEWFDEIKVSLDQPIVMHKI